MKRLIALVAAVVIAGNGTAQKPDPDLALAQKQLAHRRDLAEATVLKLIDKADVVRFDKGMEKLPKWDEDHFIHAESIQKRLDAVLGSQPNPGTQQWTELITKLTMAEMKPTPYAKVSKVEWTFNAYVKNWPRPVPSQGVTPAPQWKLTLYLTGHLGEEKAVGWELETNTAIRVAAYKNGNVPVYETVPDKDQVRIKKLPKK
jgi:hypothetical protein